MQIIADFIDNHCLINEAIAVGVSGGADSLALVLMLKESFPSRRVIALTVNHGLRPSATDEANYVADIMKKHSIEHNILVWKGEKPTTGIEEQARLARYQLLCDWCKKNGIQYLAIAHHLYDQAETFLMRLQRGSGLFGLASMQEVSEKCGITLLRPLLHTHPQVMKDYLKARHIVWVEDESNQCEDFLRVKMRKFLPQLATIGITAERIDEAVINLRRARGFIESIVAKTIDESVNLYKDCGAAFDYAHFANWHNELKFYVLSRLLTDIGGNDYVPEAESLLVLIKQLQEGGFTAATLGGVYIERSGLKVWLIKEYREDMPFDNEKWEEFIKTNPTYNGVKLPHKLKIALISQK